MSSKENSKPRNKGEIDVIIDNNEDVKKESKKHNIDPVGKLTAQKYWQKKWIELIRKKKLLFRFGVGNNRHIC
ncbi:MAG: hypothetical protein IPO45_17170 [Saprospiraceae bacterium]|nr:hypothetical protein [Candidatus Brachybacter algidus]